MKVSLPIFIVIFVISMTFSLSACKKEEPTKDAKKKSSVTNEKSEEEVKY
jgi:uncharacterized lipoprotein YehR (DUF1307 family)